MRYAFLLDMRICWKTKMFRLDPQLEKDTVAVATLALSEARLMNDARYRWVILVPGRDGTPEIHDLDAADRAALIEEVASVSALLQRLYFPEKVNVGALGNIVRQLHVHIVARRTDDPAWPGPVWGHGAAVPYDPAELERVRAEIAGGLGARNR